MNSRKFKERTGRAVMAGALVLLSQAAMSGEVQSATQAPEVVRVTLPGDWMAFAAPVDVIDELAQISAHFEALDEALKQRVIKDIASQIGTRSAPGLELAIVEVPTRG
jgi:hypothetical protein